MVHSFPGFELDMVLRNGWFLPSWTCKLDAKSILMLLALFLARYLRADLLQLSLVFLIIFFFYEWSARGLVEYFHN